MENLTTAPTESRETLPTRTNPTEKLHSIISKITVEPIALFAYIARSMINAVTENLTQEKICQQFYHGSKENCSDYIKAFNGTTIADDIQRDASDYKMYNDFITLIPAIFVVIMLAPWSDRNGRKLVLMLPLAGGALASILNTIVATVATSTPQEILFSMIPLGISGGHPMLLTSCFSYLSDVTADEERTFRIAIMDGIMTIGTPVGTLLGGFIYSKFGYAPVYIVSAALDVLILLYAGFRIENIRPDQLHRNYHEIPSENDVAPNSTGSSIVRFLQSILDNVRVCFKKRDGFLRSFILLLLLCDILHQFPITGEGQLLFLYTRKMYDWNVLNYSYMKTYLVMTGSVGVFLLMPICAKTFHIRDSILGIIGNSAKLIGGFIKMFSYTSAILWLAYSTELIAGFAVVVDRAMLSKCVPATELGKVFAVDSLLTAIATIAANMTYTQVYKSTLGTFPGTIFIISTVITLPTLLIFCYISYITRKNRNKSNTM